jgi:hypothetical protein
MAPCAEFRLKTRARTAAFDRKKKYRNRMHIANTSPEIVIFVFFRFWRSPDVAALSLNFAAFPLTTHNSGPRFRKVWSLRRILSYFAAKGSHIRSERPIFLTRLEGQFDFVFFHFFGRLARSMRPTPAKMVLKQRV